MALFRLKQFIFILYFASTFCHAAETELGDKEWIHLYHDQPIYFLLGAPETKAQFSVKMKVLTSADLYLAYTQRNFWDLFKKSSPFRDVNYNPSIFYRFHVENSPDALIDIIGYEHESNGKGDQTSRSWDRTGVRFQTVHRFDEDVRLTWSARAWIPFNYDSTNADLAKYRGVYEMIFTLSGFMGKYFDLNDLSLRFYPGGKYYINPLRGGRELTLRLKGQSTAFLANAVFQIFQGQAENMLEYNQTIWGFRAGIGL